MSNKIVSLRSEFIISLYSLTIKYIVYYTSNELKKQKVRFKIVGLLQQLIAMYIDSSLSSIIHIKLCQNVTDMCFHRFYSDVRSEERRVGKECRCRWLAAGVAT